jgi:hypothetical protein
MRTPESQRGVVELDSQVECARWRRQGRDENRNRYFARGGENIRGAERRQNRLRGRSGETRRNEHGWLLVSNHAAILLDGSVHPRRMRTATMLCLLIHLQADSKRHEHRTDQYDSQACPLENADLHKASLPRWRV